MASLEYIKCLIECNCVLSQFKNREPPVFHKFVVFLVIEPSGDVRPTYAKCNNCDAIHRVYEVGLSKQISKETMKSIPSIEDIKDSLPESIAKPLITYNCELPTWQETKFIYENELWGRPIILFREEDNHVISGKYMRIIGKTMNPIIDSFDTGEE